MGERAYPTETEAPEDEPRRLSEAPFRSALVVANPIAGRGKGAKAAGELVDGLRSIGISAESHLTTARQDAWRAVRTMGQDVDLVVSVGGDGTLSEVLGGLVDRDTPIAQYPLGTANVLAGELGLPRDVDGLLEVVSGGRTTGLDAADVNGRLSFLCVGIGIDGMAVHEVERRRDGPIRMTHYVTAMLRTLRRYRPPRLTLEIDGSRVPGEYGFVLISNVREYAAFFHLSSACRRDDGIAEVYAVKGAGVPSLIKLALTALRELPGSAADFFQGRQVRVHSDEPVEYQVDGDTGGIGDVEYEMQGARFRILVP